jgi:hypothetical protein
VSLRRQPRCLTWWKTSTSYLLEENRSPEWIGGDGIRI